MVTYQNLCALEEDYSRPRLSQTLSISSKCGRDATELEYSEQNILLPARIKCKNICLLFYEAYRKKKSLLVTFIFRTNFQRLCILKVSQQSAKHLDKIINVEQFLRKIFSVIHSNDPVARAITLRWMTLSSVTDAFIFMTASLIKLRSNQVLCGGIGNVFVWKKCLSVFNSLTPYAWLSWATRNFMGQ